MTRKQTPLPSHAHRRVLHHQRRAHRMNYHPPVSPGCQRFSPTHRITPRLTGTRAWSQRLRYNTEFQLIVISRTQHGGMPPDRAKQTPRQLITNI